MTCKHGCCESAPDCVHHAPYGALPSHVCGSCGQIDCDMTGPGHFDDDGPDTITLPEWPDDRHTVGDHGCEQGWCSGDRGSYPKSCVSTDGCPGLVHAAWGDENADGDYWLITKCDVCGESE